MTANQNLGPSSATFAGAVSAIFVFGLLVAGLGIMFFWKIRYPENGNETPLAPDGRAVHASFDIVLLPHPNNCKSHCKFAMCNANIVTVSGVVKLMKHACTHHYFYCTHYSLHFLFFFFFQLVVRSISNIIPTIRMGSFFLLL